VGSNSGVVRGVGSRYSTPVHTDPVAHPASSKMGGYRFFIPGVKQPGLDVDHKFTYSAEVKDRVEF